MRVLIFGDSVAQGFWDAYGGWVQRLAHVYHPESLQNMLSNSGQDNIEIFNLGVSGDTAEELLVRLESEAKVRKWSNDPMLIILAIGLNDARQRDNRAYMDVYKFQDVLEKVIDKAQKVADKVLCVGLTAVDDTQTNPWPHSIHKSQWHNNRINAFEDTVKQSAGHKKVPFVPIHDQFLAALEAGEDLLADGLHPNEAGHQFIADLVKPAIDKLIA